MFGINRKTEADSKTKRIKELEIMNAGYKKQIIKLENQVKQIAELENMVKQLEDVMKKRTLVLATRKRLAKEIEEEYGRIKKQNVAENKLLLRRYKELERYARALERKMDREFVKKEKPSPSLMGRIRAIRDKILDLIG